MTPYLYYEDLPAAIQWLADTFGFEECERMSDDTGKLMHAEMRLGDQLVMMGWPGPDYHNPKHKDYRHGCVYVIADPVDVHYERAKTAGAEITQELKDQAYGHRNYAASDPEGHLWYFGQPSR